MCLQVHIFGSIAFDGIVTGYDGWDILIIFLSIILTLPTLLSMYGMGLIFGSICICKKNVGFLIIIIQTPLLFITNILSLTCNATIYIIVNAIWLVFGCFIFRKALKYERTYGSLDNY